MPDQTELLLKLTQHRAEVLAVIAAMLPNFSDAEDVFQETALEIAKAKTRFDDSREFLPWIKGVARNMVRRHLRDRKQTESWLPIEDLEYLATVVDTDSGEDRWREEREALSHCLNHLTEKNRRLLLLRYGERQHVKAIAHEWATTENTLQVTLYRVRQSLRDCIRKRVNETRRATEARP